jgi:hypothetical protein
VFRPASTCALALAGRIGGDPTAEAIPLGIEYDPHHPYDAGAPEKVPADTVRSLRGRSRLILT